MLFVVFYLGNLVPVTKEEQFRGDIEGMEVVRKNTHEEEENEL